MTHQEKRTMKLAQITKVACILASPLVLLLAGGSYAQDQHPMLDQAANKVIMKYQTATCQQLWMEKANKQPPTPEQARAITFLKSDPQMRTIFINKVAAPIANKMFECGMIP
jgi:hypothetical protein